MAVYKRGKFFHYEFQIDRQRYYGSTKEKTETKARQFESLLIAKIRANGGNQFLKKAPLLCEVAKKFLDDMDSRVEAKNLDHDTRRCYYNGWRMLSQTTISRMRVDQITTGDAASLKFSGGPWNARQAQTTLGRILNWAEEEGIIHIAPRIKRTRAHGRSLRIDHAIETELLKHMEKDVADVFLIMLDCGMRPEEVLRMRWENVHWDRNEYFNPYGKTVESRRYVPISNRMQKVLRARETNGTEWAFPAKNSVDNVTLEAARALFAEGKSIRSVEMMLDLSWPMAKAIKEGREPKSKTGHRVTVTKQFDAARKAAGLHPKVVLYCARHEFATTFLESGGDLATLKKILGHTSISTTEKYLHPGIKGAAEIINKRNAHKSLHVVKSA